MTALGFTWAQCWRQERGCRHHCEQPSDPSIVDRDRHRCDGATRRTQRIPYPEKGYLDAQFGWHAGPSKLCELFELRWYTSQLHRHDVGVAVRLGPVVAHWPRGCPIARLFHTPPSDSRVHGVVPAGSSVVPWRRLFLVCRSWRGLCLVFAGPTFPRPLVARRRP